MYNKPVRIDSTIVASRLKIARENKNLSKADVAKTLNIASSSMTYYENGQAIPSIDKLYAFADFYGVTMDWLCGRVNKNEATLKTELDIAEVLLAVLQLEGVELTTEINNTDNKNETAKLVVTSPILNKFFINRFYLNQIKEIYDPQEKSVKECIKLRQEMETTYVNLLDQNELTTKDGSANYNIRRKRN